jgi:hypothetical protein
MLIHGSCHCGNITFDLVWPEQAETIGSRACTCTFCRKHGAVWTANASATLIVHVEDSRLLSDYAFGTKTADFRVCARCGVVACCTSLIGGRLYAVVNVNTFDNFDSSRLVRGDVSFDGEEEPARLARRAANWIGDVHMLHEGRG